MPKKIIYVDMDNTICQYGEAWKKSKEDNFELEYPQSREGFFLNLEPVDYSLSCIAQLEDSGVYEVWFATAPSIKNKHSYTEKATWIDEYLGEEFLSRLIIIPDKSKLKGDYLIDDNKDGNGQDRFDGELLQIGSTQWPTWIDITAHLLTVSVDE